MMAEEGLDVQAVQAYFNQHRYFGNAIICLMEGEAMSLETEALKHCPLIDESVLPMYQLISRLLILRGISDPKNSSTKPFYSVGIGIYEWLHLQPPSQQEALSHEFLTSKQFQQQISGIYFQWSERAIVGK